MVISEPVTKSDLQRMVVVCLDDFRRLLAQLNMNQLEVVEFKTLQTVWYGYYFGTFAQFDVLLKTHIEGGGNKYQPFLPLSISHHNLHRLIEVLGIELGDRPLGATRIKERIGDLFEVCNRLGILLEKNATDTMEQNSMS